MTTTKETREAYARQRSHVRLPFIRQGYVAPLHRGESYASPHDGIGFAVYALKKARAALAERDTAREAWNAAREALQVARDTGASREDVDRLAFEERKALKAASRARMQCAAPSGDYGAGTWQGGREDVPTCAPFRGSPPAMRRAGRLPSFARRMDASRERGTMFAPVESPGPFREICDAEDTGARVSSWLTDPNGDVFRDGTGLCVPVVARLRNMPDGRAVYVPGYRFGGCDDSGVFDLSRAAWAIAASREESDAEEAARDAAHVADSMAENAAEQEREYQEAWQAGGRYRDAGEELDSIRAELREILAERREARGAIEPGRFAALCELVRGRVESLLESRAELRREREELADSCPAELRDAFAEGAELEGFPA